MRIEQFSTDLTFFARHIRRKFKLKYMTRDALSMREPTLFFGCAGKTQCDMVMAHQGFAVIVWAGSDSMLMDRRGGMAEYFRKNTDRIFHIAHSHWIQSDLKQRNIPYIDRVIFPVEFDKAQFTVEPLGDCVYHYAPVTKSREEFYGTTVVKKMMKMNGNNHILPPNKFIITNAGAFPRDKIHLTYRRAFVGVRLTDHDNMALSCVEMGLMGRRSIFNGNIPGAIPYKLKEPGHVMDLVLQEYQYSDPDRALAEEMWDFVQDDMTWLDTKYYENYSSDPGKRTSAVG